jgi:hypothetical protein
MASSYMQNVFGTTDTANAPREFEIQQFCDQVNKRAIVDYQILDLAKIAKNETYRLPYECINQNVFLVVDSTATGNSTATYTLQLPPAEKCSGRSIHLHYIDDNSTVAGTPGLANGALLGSIVIQCGLDSTSGLGDKDFMKGSIVFGSNVVIHKGIGGANDCIKLTLAKPTVGLRLTCYAAGNVWYITGVAQLTAAGTPALSGASTCVFSAI